MSGNKTAVDKDKELAGEYLSVSLGVPDLREEGLELQVASTHRWRNERLAVRVGEAKLHLESRTLRPADADLEFRVGRGH